MKIAMTFLIICFVAMGLFLIGIGCNGDQQPPTDHNTNNNADLGNNQEEEGSAMVRRYDRGPASGEAVPAGRRSIERVHDSRSVKDMAGEKPFSS